MQNRVDASFKERTKFLVFNLKFKLCVFVFYDLSSSIFDNNYLDVLSIFFY